MVFIRSRQYASGTPNSARGVRKVYDNIERARRPLKNTGQLEFNLLVLCRLPYLFDDANRDYICLGRQADQRRRSISGSPSEPTNQ